MKWDEWRGSLDGRPTMWIKRVLKLFGCRIDLHKFVRADDENCFHTHPAWAIRIPLWNGYCEEVYRDGMGGFFRVRLPLEVSIVEPGFCHRVHSVISGVSYSLWLRGPICADVELKGHGWGEQAGAHPERN